METSDSHKMNEGFGNEDQVNENEMYQGNQYNIYRVHCQVYKEVLMPEQTEQVLSDATCHKSDGDLQQELLSGMQCLQISDKPTLYIPPGMHLSHDNLQELCLTWKVDPKEVAVERLLKHQEVIDIYRENLEKTGIMQQLESVTAQSLDTMGWTNRVEEKLRTVVRDYGKSEITFDDLYDAMVREALGDIPSDYFDILAATVENVAATIPGFYSDDKLPKQVSNSEEEADNFISLSTRSLEISEKNAAEYSELNAIEISEPCAGNHSKDSDNDSTKDSVKDSTENALSEVLNKMEYDFRKTKYPVPERPKTVPHRRHKNLIYKKHSQRLEIMREKILKIKTDLSLKRKTAERDIGA